MDNQETFEFQVQMNAKNLWYFSLHHANKGYLGVFNVLFTLASLYLLVTTWNESAAPSRLLLVFCISIFTLIQPGQLYLKAKKQASLAVMKEPIRFRFTTEDISIQQGEQQQELKWEQIVRIEPAKGMLVIYMDRIHAYLITDEAMGDQKGKFCAMLREALPKERRKRI